MARMTMPLTTEANTATLRPRSSGLGIAVGQLYLEKVYFISECPRKSVLGCDHMKQLTFADRQVVAPLRFAVPDIAVDFVAADQLVSLPAPEGQHAADRHARAGLHVEGTPTRRQDGDTAQT